MTLSVFVGTSLDGFIARRNGRYDFLPAVAASLMDTTSSSPVSIQS
jgi:hypothetical protein